jgi:cytochrome c biogenesis protein
MNEIKCECGHVNPIGTVLCEACGKALAEEAEKNELHDMRYEGSARRSQTYNKTIIDKIWNFFSSVKVGVWLIVITLLASIIGTILPQEMYIPKTMTPAQFYAQEYGWFGTLYYKLGFHNLYGSWWYLLLIALIGVSLVICSLDRVIPLHRALKNQRVTRHESFMRRQRLFSQGKVENVDVAMEQLEKLLKEKRYHVRKENGNIFAEKGRFSRWGPYVNHIGLIVFLIGAMLRFVPGMYVDEVLWIKEGETKQIPGTQGEYYLKNNQFILEVYDKEKDPDVFQQAIDRVGVIAKTYQTNVELYKVKDSSNPNQPSFEKVKEQAIRVNEPLKFNGYALYQVDYRLNELQSMTFNLTNKQTGESFGTITIDLFNPQEVYDLGNGYQVELIGYYPDFSGFAENGEPQTKSPNPNNPAFLFKMHSPEKPDGEISFVAIQETIEPLGENLYKMSFAGIEMKNLSALIVRKDLTLWILGLGGTIFMIGLIQGSYWNHRRLWVQRKNGEILLAAHTNKNWHGLKREMESMFKQVSFPPLIDQKIQNNS